MTGSADIETPTDTLPVPHEPWDEAAARAVIVGAAERYIAGCRERVGPFVDRHFSLFGTLKLHRKAFGWDLLKAPYNVAVAIPQLSARLLAAGGKRVPGGRRLSARMEKVNLFLNTSVGREVGWLVFTEFLRLPADDGKGRVSKRDAFAEEVLADPRVRRSIEGAAAAVGKRADDPEFLKGLEDKLASYTNTRAAAADMVGVLSMVGAGAAATHQFTPGAVTLVPALSAAIAQQMAIASFPLGTGLGGLWYSVFPAAVTPGVIAATAGTVLAAGAVITAFAGVIADPIQRKLGVHKRRLDKLLDALETELTGSDPKKLVLHDHYVARTLDLVDVMLAVTRFAGRA